MRISLVSTFLGFSMLLASPAAFAVGKDEASPAGKGVTGGALLGAETVMLVEAALDVKPAWAYVVGGLAGGVAGGVGGFFYEDSVESARGPMFLLAGGMALVIPTTVAVLATTAYRPPPDYVQDKAPADEPVAEPPQPNVPPAPPGEGAQPPPTSRWRLKRPTPSARLHRPAFPPALFGLERGALTLSVPAVEVREMYSKREIAMFGVRQAQEVRMPVFNVAF
jgi:hypothetical protein